MFLTILYTVLIFGVIIFIHELGHFVCAKLSGIEVHEFAMGMGPKLISKQKGETLYSLRLFPIGGFCAMEGEDENSESPRAFNKKSVPVRILVLAAGAIMNLLLGLILFIIINASDPSLASNTVAVFNEGATSSQEGGLQVGDEIKKVNGKKTHITKDILYGLMRDKDGLVDFEVVRNGETIQLTNVKFNQVTDDSGNTTTTLDFKVKAVKNSFFANLQYSFWESVTTAKMVWWSFGDLITGNVGLNQLSGPVGIAGVVGEAASMGWASLLSIAAFLTINVGVFNLLPLPALDGGRLLFVIIEGVRGKPVKAEHEGWVHAVGMILLLGLMAVVTLKDIFSLF